MPGRNKEPIALIEAKGKKHLTKAEKEAREKTELKVPNDSVLSPGYLTANQKKEFVKISDQLIALKIMTNLDVDSLARYITARDMYERLSKKMRSRECMSDINLLDKTSRIQKRFFDECKSSASELGLTISSRCRLVLPDPKPIVPPKANKFEKFNAKTANG